MLSFHLSLCDQPSAHLPSGALVVKGALTCAASFFASFLSHHLLSHDDTLASQGGNEYRKIGRMKAKKKRAEAKGQYARAYCRAVERVPPHDGGYSHQFLVAPNQLGLFTLHSNLEEAIAKIL